MNAFLLITLWTQAIYFFVTGIWPIVHLPSFEAVTGPKNDKWLVRTVGALIAVIALALGAAAYERGLSAPVVVLAIGSAVALLLVDVIYVARRVIPPIYLLDAFAEFALVVAWILGLAMDDGRT